MTVMIGFFFGMPQAVIRKGFWAKMKPGEKDLYTYLLHESERFCSREFTRRDAEVRAAVNLASRTACNARKKLQEHGLIRYRSTAGNRYAYTICDPETGSPYPGDPKKKIDYTKRPRTLQGAQITTPKSNEKRLNSADVTPESHGLPLSFSE